jgi:bacteriorhodopsin
MESSLVYSQSQWDVVLASFVLAGFALFATFVYLLTTRKEISPRYRPAGSAGALIGLIASAAYLLLSVSWLTGFHFDRATATFHPSDSVLQFRNAYRYVDWAVTVPLLSFELVFVSTLSGARARRTRVLLGALAFLMIVTGFLGADTFDSTTGRLVWGLVSTVFFVPLYVILLRTAFRSARELGEPAGPSLRRAGLMLSWTWGVYPLAYCVPFFFAGSSGWAVATQLAFTLTDIAAKVGYGFFVHAVAKARTAEDVAAGQTVHPEDVYVDQVKVADGRASAEPALTSPGADARRPSPTAARTDRA